MDPQYPDELVASFRLVADSVYAGDSLQEVYATACRTAVQVIDGCDHASLMVMDGDRASTVAFSDEQARVADALEVLLGEGPCVDAADEDEPDEHLCADLASGSRWPVLAQRLTEETSIRGVGGFRIRMEGRKEGALNVFSSTPGALTADSMDQATVLAAFVSMALMAARRGEDSASLRRGLESNREIGKAVGLLMAAHDLPGDQAFEILVRLSQDMNVKLTQVAADVLARHREDTGAARV